MTLRSLLHSRYRNYIWLVPVAIFALAYQITYTVISIQAALNWQKVATVPFTTNDDAKVTAVSKETAGLGLKKDDLVLRINNREVDGNRVLFEEVARHTAGQSIAVEVVPAGQSPHAWSLYPLNLVATAPLPLELGFSRPSCWPSRCCACARASMSH